MQGRPLRQSALFLAGFSWRALGLLATLTLAATNAGCSSDDDSKADNGSNPTGSDFADAQIYVDAHNAVRAAVAKPDGYAGSWQALPPVAWSDEVATTAQAWANHLRDTASCGLMHASNTGYGENLAAGTRLDAQGAVDLWAAEKQNYTYSPKYVFSSDTGHYTQIAWRKTTHIGCGSAQCASGTVIACRYDPPGNYLGEQIF